MYVEIGCEHDVGDSHVGILHAGLMQVVEDEWRSSASEYHRQT